MFLYKAAWLLYDSATKAACLLCTFLYKAACQLFTILFQAACRLCAVWYRANMQQDMTKSFQDAQPPHTRQSGVWHYLRALACFFV